MNYYYAEVDSEGTILQQLRVPSGEGVPETPLPHEGCTMHLLSEPIDWRDIPTPTCVMKWVDGAPQLVETAPLSECKAQKNIEINLQRLRANRESFTFSGKEIACDELSRSDIDAVNGIVALTGNLPPNWIGFWKAIDNSYVAISDVGAWTSFFVAMVTKGSENFAYAQSLKTQLAQATTHAEVAAITWEANTQMI